jgi:serine/threonine protein kinase
MSTNPPCPTGEFLCFYSVYLVMDFLEHDLKTLLDDMQEPFLPSETKTILQQILSATEFLHSNWILHRDLKTSNLLLNNRGEVKLADFGMARYFGDPKPAHLTQLVVTLWYRAPELLLGAERYGAEIDMWSVGCIFGELLRKEPLFQGRNEVDQLSKVCTPPPLSLCLLGMGVADEDRYSQSPDHQPNKSGLALDPYQTPNPSVSRLRPLHPHPHHPLEKLQSHYSPAPNSHTSQTQA